MIKVKTNNGKIRIKMKGSLANIAADTLVILKGIRDTLDKGCAGDGTIFMEFCSALSTALSSPVMPGDTVYWLLDDDGWYVSDGEKVADVGIKGFYTNGVTGLADTCDCPSFTPWAELGKNVFRSREEAEAALAKMKEA